MWPRSILIAFDQFWNAVFKGNPDETVSSRLGKLERANVWWAVLLCKVISFILRDPNHCIGAIEEDE